MSEDVFTPEEVIEKIQKTITEKTEGFASKEEIESIKEDIAAVKEIAEKGESNEATNDLKVMIAKMEGQIEGLKEVKKHDAPKAKSMGEAIFNAFKSAKEDIQKIASKGGLMNLDVKAPDTMTITGNYSGGTVGLSTLEGGLNRIARRKPFMRQLVNSAGTTSKYVVWIEQANADPGVAGMTAEGALKNQTDFDLVEKSCEVKKITAFIKVSKEMIQDIPFMQGEINGELMQLVELKLDEQILLGDGLGNNLTGVMENAIPFSAPAQFVGSIPQANNSDVLRIAISQVATGNFEANYIVMNPEDVAGMELTKDSNGAYTYPMFVPMADGITRVKGIPVIENNGVPAGEYLVGDFTKDNLRMRQEMNVQVGYVNDDFTKNLMTVLVEARACNFVKTNDYGAFVKGVFATDIAVIDQP
jgi:HK97 family phage major capsid protein